MIIFQGFYLNHKFFIFKSRVHEKKRDNTKLLSTNKIKSREEKERTENKNSQFF